MGTEEVVWVVEGGRGRGYGSVVNGFHPLPLSLFSSTVVGKSNLRVMNGGVGWRERVKIMEGGRVVEREWA